MFAKALLRLRSEIFSRLKVNQRWMVRLALGTHGKNASEAVPSVLAWDSLEVKVAQRKFSS